ncbi:MAG TPA: ABC transporter substrate-binding protein [Acidothermaceae bacterium]
MRAMVRRRSTALLVATAAVSLVAAGCSSSKKNTATPSSAAPATSAAASVAAPSSSAPAPASSAPAPASSAPTPVSSAPAPASSAAAPADPFATPNAASGSPVVFGVLNIQSGPVTFPETLQAEQAAVSYVNAYKGGIGGHPIKLVSCITDGQPSTSQRCANQILSDKPVAIMGGADTGAPGAIPVWQRANLAYLGGVPFTPAEQNYANAVIFSSISTADNAAASVYAAQTLGVKSAAVIATSDTQGTSVMNNVIIPTMKAAGITKVTPILLPPTSSDVSSAVATALGAHPDLIYINAPAACPNILASLKQLGNTAKIMGIDPCTSPPALKGANGGANGLYFASPVFDPGSGTPDSNEYLAIVKKYQPNLVLDSPAAIGFQTVFDVQAALASFTTADLTTAKILAAFRTGQSTPNFMGHPYLCDGKQLAGAPAICNSYEQIRQVQGTSIVVASKDFVTPGAFYKG